MRATKPWWKGRGWKCVRTVRQSASKQCFRPQFGLQMTRLLLKDQSPTNYEAMVSPQLRITDASFVAEGPLADQLQMTKKGARSRVTCGKWVLRDRSMHRCVAPLWFCSKKSVTGNDFNISFCTYRSYNSHCLWYRQWLTIWGDADDLLFIWALTVRVNTAINSNSHMVI